MSQYNAVSKPSRFAPADCTPSLYRGGQIRYRNRMTVQYRERHYVTYSREQGFAVNPHRQVLVQNPPRQGVVVNPPRTAILQNLPQPTQQFIIPRSSTRSRLLECAICIDEHAFEICDRFCELTSILHFFVLVTNHKNLHSSTMTQVNFLTRWKIQLDSNDHKMQLVALLEIVEMFKTLSEEISDSVYVLLINSDICHFLSEIMSCRNRTAMCLINKIVCHLSETEEFFKNDFYRILKGYTRVIKSLPTADFSSAEVVKFQKDIFVCATIFIKRARERECNFKDERMSFNCIIATISNISEAFMERVEVLDYVNLIIELMKVSPPVVEKDIAFRDLKLLEILKKLSLKLENFQSLMFTSLTSKIIHQILLSISVNNDFAQPVHNLMFKAMIEKFFPLMDFTMTENTDEKIYEVFCNMFYYLLTSEKLKMSHKMQLLNRFFVVNGHNYMASSIGCNDPLMKTQAKHFKSLIVMSEVVNVLLKFLTKSSDSELSFKKLCYEIVFNANMEQMDLMENKASHETMLMYAFLSFVDMRWKNSEFNSNKVLCNVSLVLIATRAKQTSMNPTFFNMLTTLYMFTFRQVAIPRNNLLLTSSALILESAHSKNIGLSFLKWWRVMGNPKHDEVNEAAMKFLLDCESWEIENLQPTDLLVFDQQLIMRKFLDTSTTSIKVHTNLKIVLCNFTTIEPEHHQLLLKRLKYLRTETAKKKKHQQQQLINVLDVMATTIASLTDLELRKKTASALMKILTPQAESKHVKLAAIQIATNLMSYKNLTPQH